MARSSFMVCLVKACREGWPFLSSAVKTERCAEVGKPISSVRVIDQRIDIMNAEHLLAVTSFIVLFCAAGYYVWQPIRRMQAWQHDHSRQE
jgi:hypothetical protein